METSKRIYIGTAIFGFSGFFQAFSAWWFWYAKDQRIYTTGLASAQFLAFAGLAFVIPESPLYLLEKENFAELRKCLRTIGSINRVADLDIKVDYCLLRLKLKTMRQKEEKR